MGSGFRVKGYRGPGDFSFDLMSRVASGRGFRETSAGGCRMANSRVEGSSLAISGVHRWTRSAERLCAAVRRDVDSSMGSGQDLGSAFWGFHWKLLGCSGLV